MNFQTLLKANDIIMQIEHEDADYVHHIQCGIHAASCVSDIMQLKLIYLNRPVVTRLQFRLNFEIRVQHIW